MARLGYCSACDRNVPVALRAPLDRDTTPGASDPQALVCLDYGVRCTGNLCPLFTVPGPEPERQRQRQRARSTRREARPT